MWGEVLVYLSQISVFCAQSCSRDRCLVAMSKRKCVPVPTDAENRYITATTVFQLYSTPHYPR
jgi:hypothetical protein